MNILLCCSLGMSTSLLVSKMRKCAKEQGLDYRIWAIAVDAVPKQFDQADVMLLGPQVRFMLPEFKEMCKSSEIPVAVIKIEDYGTFNGQAVLTQAQQLYMEKKKE